MLKTTKWFKKYFRDKKDKNTASISISFDKQIYNSFKKKIWNCKALFTRDILAHNIAIKR